MASPLPEGPEVGVQPPHGASWTDFLETSVRNLLADNAHYVWKEPGEPSHSLEVDALHLADADEHQHVIWLVRSRALEQEGFGISMPRAVPELIGEIFGGDWQSRYSDLFGNRTYKTTDAPSEHPHVHWAESFALPGANMPVGTGGAVYNIDSRSQPAATDPYQRQGRATLTADVAELVTFEPVMPDELSEEVPRDFTSLV